MYRLAALYEERARSRRGDRRLEIGLKPAIALYKRVIKRVPEVPRARRHLLLPRSRAERLGPHRRGAAGLALARLPQQVPVPDAARSEEPGHRHDHAAARRTRRRSSGRRGASAITRPEDGPQGQPGDDLRRSVPAGLPVASRSLASARARTRSTSPRSGGRSATGSSTSSTSRSGVVEGRARRRLGATTARRAPTSTSMKYKKPPLYGVALYKYAWTLFKQQRYERATKQFVVLLLHRRAARSTGDTGVGDFRSEAYTYIAGSLTNVDFEGPEEWEPYIQRPDIVDTEPKPEVAEKKLHVAIDRVKDPSSSPRTRPGRSRSTRRSRASSDSLNQFDNAVEVYELILKKWPMDPTAPDVQNEIAETYDQMQRHEEARARPSTTRSRAEGARGAHQARELHRQHAVGRREQGQPRRDPERRASRARRSPSGGRARTRTSASSASSPPAQTPTRRQRSTT